MSNISGKINLAALEHAVIKTKSGDEAIVIPIGKNNLFKSDKGNVYLDLFANEIDANKRRADSKDTHIVSQSVSKEVREKLKAESKYPPTLGNLAVWGGGGYSEPSPAATSIDLADNTEDLPF